MKESTRLPPWATAPWIAGALTGLLIASVDRPQPAGWAAYAAFGAVCGGLAGSLWRSVVGAERPRLLQAALLSALGLRLALGLAWGSLLPAYGNDVPHHAAGFFFPDSFVRDRSAWTIGRTDASLLESFDDAKGDQYGSLLFVTAMVYRLFGPEVDRTAIVTALAAAFGALAVVPTWGFVRRVFGVGAAGIAAWWVALYPDAVLLGSQPMREPFVLAGIAAALYGYGLIRGVEAGSAARGGVRAGLGWIAGGCLLGLIVSPPFGAATAGLVGLAWVWEGRGGRRTSTVVLSALALLCAVALALTIRAWAIEGGATGAGGALSWWVAGVSFELSELARASGWVQVIFGQTPAWSHPLLATAYGLLQPFLPAALADNSGVALMRLVMIWRALGWFLGLPVLLYAPFASIRREGMRSPSTYFTIVILVASLLISYRFAGDQWDSPRYRTALLPFLASLVGWAWAEARSRRDRWLAWAYFLVAIESLVVGWWYAGRYYHIPRLSLFRTVGIAAVLGALLIVLAFLVERGRRPALDGPAGDV